MEKTPHTFFEVLVPKINKLREKTEIIGFFFGQKLQFYSNFLHNEISETTSFQTTDIRVLIFTADELCL